MNEPNPPQRAERLVKWSLAPWERPAVMGDLQEEFRDLAEAAGEPAAQRWYWRQAIRSLWPNFMRRLRADDRRRSRWWASIASMANGCLMLGLGLTASTLANPTRDPFRSPFVGVAWIVLGAIGATQSVFRKRLKAPVSQARAVGAYAVLTMSGCFVGALLLPSPPRSTEMVLLVGLSAIELWPWWPPDPPPAEYLVGRRADPDQDPAELLTITVPNVPLGMSGLVLLHAPAGATVDTAPRPIRRSAPTLDRTFTLTDAVRVCAVVNLAGPSAQATVDVVDAAGRIAQTVQTTVGAGSLEQVVKKWDEIVDDDPAEHFGQVDVTLPLAGLAPGPYCLRLTATDAAHTSRQEESIVVRDGSGRRGR
jgi:hypothetical protein